MKRNNAVLAVNVVATLILAASLLMPSPASACDAATDCDKCAKDPEFSWNPESRSVTPRLKRFYKISDELQAAYLANDLNTAHKLATEYLELANAYRCNWNYGNAIHDANSYLGLMSLRNGNIDAAVGFLRDAGKSPGSPQLDSFGPDFELANQLLQQGQTEAVKSYLKDVQKFWKSDNGAVAGWLASIDNGDKPTLERFIGAKPVGLLDALFLWVQLTCPLIAIAAVFAFARKRIVRKWLFLLASIVAGYVAIVIVVGLTGWLLPAVIERVSALGERGITFFFILISVAGIAVPVLAVVWMAYLFRKRPNAPQPVATP